MTYDSNSQSLTRNEQRNFNGLCMMTFSGLPASCSSTCEKETYVCGGAMRPPHIQTSAVSASRALGDLRVVQRRVGLSENRFNQLVRAATVARENMRAVLGDAEMTKAGRFVPQQGPELSCRVGKQSMHKRAGVIFAPLLSHA